MTDERACKASFGGGRWRAIIGRLPPLLEAPRGWNMLSRFDDSCHYVGKRRAPRDNKRPFRKSRERDLAARARVTALNTDSWVGPTSVGQRGEANLTELACKVSDRRHELDRVGRVVGHRARSESAAVRVQRLAIFEAAKTPRLSDALTLIGRASLRIQCALSSAPDPVLARRLFARNCGGLGNRVRRHYRYDRLT